MGVDLGGCDARLVSELWFGETLRLIGPGFPCGVRKSGERGHPRGRGAGRGQHQTALLTLILSVSELDVKRSQDHMRGFLDQWRTAAPPSLLTIKSTHWDALYPQEDHKGT